MKRYTISKYKSNSKELLFESNSIEEIQKYWLELMINEASYDTTDELQFSSGIEYCPELKYCKLYNDYHNSNKEYTLRLETPEYYNTNEYSIL